VTSSRLKLKENMGKSRSHHLHPSFQEKMNYFSICDLPKSTDDLHVFKLNVPSNYNSRRSSAKGLV
jgi:hypothetical protein